MASRPAFYPTASGKELFLRRDFEIKWHGGFAESQKQKNIAELHGAASHEGGWRLLEISTKSQSELGRRLSAFSLKYYLNDHPVPMECLYQGSKVFRDGGGPFTDLFDKAPIECKKDPRIRESGPLLYFELDGCTFSPTPFNAFYDWIYIRCIYKHEVFLSKHLSCFDGFTDIEFNPQRSLNCQARALAIAVSLINRKLLTVYAEDFERFRVALAPSFSSL